VWLDSENVIAGLQACYIVEGQAVLGYLHGRSLSGLAEASGHCQGDDYFQGVTAMFGVNYLEHLRLVTRQGLTHEFGVIRPKQKQVEFSIRPEERPFCLLGAYEISEKTQHAYFTQLGFEITRIRV
jgi:hypothetical protein